MSSAPLSPDSVHIPSTSLKPVTWNETETEINYCDDVGFEDIFEDIIEREHKREQYLQRIMYQTQRQSHLIHCSDSIKEILRQGKSNLNSYLELRGDGQSDLISKMLEQQAQLYSMLEMEQNKLQCQLLSSGH